MASADPNAPTVGTTSLWTPFHKIVPTGDVILEVNKGSNSQKFLVSSQILRLLSIPFAAMLGPHFLEGTKLLNLPPGEPATVNLPDDDADGMRVLLNLLHLRKPNVDPRQMSFELIAQVAILCDKYMVAECLQPYIATWLSSTDTMTKYRGNAAALALSYAFLDHTRFYDASLNLIVHTSKEEILQDRITPMYELEEVTEKLFDILPDTLLEKVDRKREAAIRSFHYRIEQAITPFLENLIECTSFGHSSPLLRRACDKPHMVVWIFSQLKLIKLWPLSNINMAISVQKATEFLEEYEEYPLLGRTCECSTRSEIKPVFAAIIAACRNDTPGLCLECVKGGRLCKDEGNCEGRVRCCADDEEEEEEDDG